MDRKKLKFLFIVQGEGRGHLTQSLVLQELLLKAGHEIVGVMVGKSPRREIPSFYYDKIQAPVTTFFSPNFLVDHQNKSIRVLASILFNLKKSRTFLNSLRIINQKVKESKPDVIVNFYELLCGIYFLLYQPKVRHITLAHHYLLSHPEFQQPSGNFRDKNFMRLNNFLTSFGANKILALSFRDLPRFTENRMFVVPPLLRREVKSVISTEGQFFLAYILNHGYSEEIIQWHERNQDLEVHCFWDKKEVKGDYNPHKNLFFHKLDEKRFLEMMAHCKAYLSTAGFESVCEAMYLGKPIFLVPTGGHFEQTCNALEAAKAGAGFWSTSFNNCDDFLHYLPNHISAREEFKRWANLADERYLNCFEEW